MTDTGVTRAERARNLRYKHPALASLGYQAMGDEIYDIVEACSDVRWADEDTLLDALGGDEEALWEFKMAFGDLCAKAERLQECIGDWVLQEEYDTCTVALIGNQYRTVGYDAYEEDYYGLTCYEEKLAHTEAGQRLMRRTKPDMLAMIGQCLGTLIAFLDLRQSYDYLRATLDILRDASVSLLQQIKSIDAAYTEADANDWRGPEACRYNEMLACLPDRVWLE